MRAHACTGGREALQNHPKTIQNHAFPRLLKVNNIDPNLTPKLTHAPVRNVDLKELGEYVTKLTGAGAELFPDDNLEAYLREVGGLPVSTEAESVD